MSGPRGLPVLLGAALAAALSAGCADTRAGPTSWDDVAEEERRGGTAVVASRVGIATLNPLVATDYLARQIGNHLLYTPVLHEDSSFRASPWLAEGWELNEDSTQIRFRIREGVAWHDGAPVTARDVAFTFERARDPRIAYPNRAYFDHFEGAEVVGTSELRLVLSKRAGFLFGWTQLPILPAHILSEVATEELGAHPLGPEGPLGSGPFRFAGRQGTDRWTFEANADFPADLGGPPHLERLVYRQIPNETTLVSELRAGRVHLVTDLPPGSVARLRADTMIRVVTYPSRTYAFIAWNTRRPVLRDAEVRRALTLAIDRQALLATVREGLGTVASGPVGPWHWAHDPAWRPLPHAPDSARALLERAGWRPGPDGVRVRDGQRLAFDLLTTDSRMRQDIATIVQAQLARIGVEVRVRTLEPAAVGAAVTSPERRFDGVVLAFEQDPELDERDQWACARIGRPFHFSGFCDPELDRVLEAIPATVDRDARRDLYRQFHEIVARGQPYTFLWFEDSATGVRQELRGVRVDARGPLVSAREWWLHPAARGAGR